MANMFRCTLASGGGAIVLTVTCDADFAGLTITATDGTTTLTQPCPSSSPYEVEFRIPNAGQWTISGVISGETQSITVDIPDNVALHNIPNGSTVTPTDDIQIWLHCAGIWDKNYTTISQILADASTLQALIASNNASDYMARSTTWASSVTADSSAMTYIGLNDYCSDALLANSTWLNAICNSTYFESVLNVKVPTMTSNTSPYGEASASNVTGSYSAFKAFDGVEPSNASSSWVSGKTNFPQWLMYDFGEPIKIKKAQVLFNSYNTSASCTIEASNDGSDFESIDTLTVTGTTRTWKNIDDNEYRYWRLKITAQTRTTSDSTIGQVTTLQFYGRA